VGQELVTPHCKKPACNEILHRVMYLDKRAPVNTVMSFRFDKSEGF
jgi:hypothetical protein